jgi:4-diphosphocytidyl-2-C-methyl-D-erythritol kinase
MRAYVRVPAKVNLHLEVLARRPDGFHELQTLLQSIDLYDELTASPAEDGCYELTVEPEGAVGADQDNLVSRAARELWRHLGARPGARVTLRKRIPVGGGLGGGSADAAAALLLFDALWGAGIDRGELNRIASLLGSDVPFFLDGGFALGLGRGEQVHGLADLDELGVVLVVPDIEISTAEVYGRLDLRLTSPAQRANVMDLTADLRSGSSWEGLVNDLQPVVLAGWPGVSEALDALRAAEPLHAAVSGSGAAVFGVFADVRAAQLASKTIGRGWRLHVGKTLTRGCSRPTVTGLEGLT